MLYVWHFKFQMQLFQGHSIMGLFFCVLDLNEECIQCVKITAALHKTMTKR